MQITGINPVSLTNTIQEIGSVNNTTSPNAANSIGETFSSMLDSLNESQLNADNLMTKLASGEDVDLHEVILASEENDVNFQVAMSIRDKLVDAYREVMRMSV